MILGAYDRSDAPRFRDLCGRDVAQSDVAYQALLLEPGQNRERRFNRAFCRLVDIKHHAQVDHIQRVQAQVAEVVVNRAGQLFR